VAIQVFVTDKDGKAVSGLTAEDFSVTDEKKERPVLALYEVDASAPVLTGAGSITRATALYPPLFMNDPNQGVILRERSGFEPRPTIPYRVADEAFTPSGKPQLDKDRAHRVFVMFSDNGTQYESGAEFEVKPQLLTSDGVPARLSSLHLEKAIIEPDSFRRFVLSFKVENIPSGDYTFVVKLVDPSTGYVTETQQDVWVN
jgi:hypothetical protein